MEILQAKDLKKIYGTGENAVHALDGVNLTVEKGEFVAIVGTSGSGKSTLLHMLGGLDRPTGGSVVVDGTVIFDDRNSSALKDEELTIFRRRKIGFVFQAYNLVPVLNVYENIVLPIELDGAKVDAEFVEQIVHTLGLEARLDALPNQLSGGQQQRVAIARALASAPAIILADEPTGNLDSKTSLDVLSLLKITSQQFAQTILMITHNEEIAQMADRIIRIEDGKVRRTSSHSQQRLFRGEVLNLTSENAQSAGILPGDSSENENERRTSSHSQQRLFRGEVLSLTSENAQEQGILCGDSSENENERRTSSHSQQELFRGEEINSTHGNEG